MNFQIPQLTIRQITNTRFLAILYLVAMCVQIVFIEGPGVSLVKVALMALAPLIFLLKCPYMSKALIWALLFWMVCYFCASFQEKIRFSSVGYLGMFVFSYVLFYTLVHKGAFTLNAFIRLIKRLVLAFSIVLVLQQLCLLIGIRNMPLINLSNQFFLSLNKLPSLTLEPSHTARILTVMMLAYLRCQELKMGHKLELKELFGPEHKWISIAFLWAMLTMGSGTAFIGLALLGLYFVQRRTIMYIVSLFVGLFFLGQYMELEQMDRAVRVARATMTGNTNEIQQEDGSAAVRVVPLVNTFIKTDLTKKQSWIGKGILDKESAFKIRRESRKIAVVDQFGLLGLIMSLILVYGCMIKRFFSLETLIYVVLLGFSLGNIAYSWGCMMMFTVVCYFQEQQERGILKLEE